MARDAGTTPTLVVVDMQDYFCRQDSVIGRLLAVATDDGGAWYYDRLDRIVIPNIARLVEAFRARGLPIVFTEFGSRTADGSDLPAWARRHDRWSVSHLGDRCYRPLSEPTSRVIDELAPSDQDVVIEKATSGPLAGTDLHLRLRSTGCESAVVTGIMTDVCVTGMARELADSDFAVTLPVDACAASQQMSHEAALVCLKTFARLTDVEGVVASLDPVAPRPGRRSVSG